MIEGIVKNWDQLKGWGFIEDDEGYDYFLNIQDIRPGYHIKAGDRVKFDVYETHKGPTAENVMIIKK
ncbi:MAG: cold shock domain-containing protein [Bacteroidetes bacterium]|nr:cold shock domain-containing protein [Bacteroidota bacterium]